jgi:hypothetical protein
MERCLLIEKALPSGPKKAARKLEQAKEEHAHDHHAYTHVQTDDST